MFCVWNMKGILALFLFSSTLWLEWAFKLAHLMVPLSFKIKSSCFHVTYKFMTYRSAYLCLAHVLLFPITHFTWITLTHPAGLIELLENKTRFPDVSLTPFFHSHNCCYSECFWSILPLTPHSHPNWKTVSFSPLYTQCLAQ